MLTTIAVMLIFLSLLGVAGVYSIGWFIHLLLVAAIIMFLMRIIQGRREDKRGYEHTARRGLSA